MKKIDITKYITTNPEVCHGKPVFKDTRIMVEQVLELLEADLTVAEITGPDYYPQLTPDHVHAALRYAQELLKTRQYA